ncbi:MAG: hypothetical protein LBD74_03710, partial [Spirochaetaceae bacterium]|nr:hypothetical protein [Spirochaetaceae bacterium]
MQRRRIGAALCMAALCLGPVFAKGSQDKQAAGPETAVPYTIEIAGSTSVTPLMELLAAEYARLHRTV